MGIKLREKLSYFYQSAFTIMDIPEKQKVKNYLLLNAEFDNSQIQKQVLKDVKEVVKKHHTHSQPIMNEHSLSNFHQGVNKHIVCGFHSGFPACCVHHYISKWLFALRDSSCSYYAKHRAKLNSLRLSGIDVQYVACPKCVKMKNIVQLKECDCYGSR